MHTLPPVDYYLGPHGSSAPDQKWFDRWYRLVMGQIDAQFLFTRAKYVPNRAGGAWINSWLRGLELERKRRRDTLLHIPTQLFAEVAAQRRSDAPVLVTCHDVCAYLPEGYALTGVRYPPALLALQQRAMQRADAILTDSVSAKQEIVRLLQIDPERVHMVYLGVDADWYRPQPRDPALMRRYGFAPDRPNLLYVGSEAPRKNLHGIAHALATLRQRKQPFRLIKVGGVRSWETHFRGLVDELGLTDDVVWHSNVPETELPALYHAADLFLFPSFYEGFGLPVLEAMAAGCPVITSTATSLPELAGDAAILIDPHSPPALAEAIERVLQDPALATGLRERGLIQARRFTWHHTATQTLALYDRLLGRAPSEIA